MRNFTYGTIENYSNFHIHGELTLHENNIVLLNNPNFINITYWSEIDGVIKFQDSAYSNILALNKIENKYTELYTGQNGKNRIFMYENKLPKPKVKLLIASNVDYIKTTKVNENLRDLGLDDNDVSYVLSGADNEKDEGNFHYTKTNHWEYSALLRASSIPNHPDYWLLLHDTCLFGKDFKHKKDLLNFSLPFDIVYTSEDGKFNTGYYRHEFLSSDKTKEYLLSIKDINKTQSIFIELNSSISHLAKSTAMIVNGHTDRRKELFVWGNTKRREIYINCLDVYKYFYYSSNSEHVLKP